MKKLHFISILAVCLAVQVACKPSATTQSDTEADASNVFGEAVEHTADARPFAEVAALLDERDSVATTLRARVSGVCQAKGCWMNIVDPATETEEAEAIFVQFKDYGFFVPKDIAGQEVIIEGIAYREQTTVDELRHYAEDAGKSAEEIAAITEPVTEKKFMASGVVLLK